MPKIKLSQLAELTDTYTYRGDSYELKITEEDGEKYIEIKDVNEKRLIELENIIQRDKEVFFQLATKFCSLPKGALIYKEYNNFKDGYEIMQQHIYEYDRIKNNN